MMRSQCDNCQKLGDVPAPHCWVYLSVIVPAPAGELIALIGSGTSADTVGLFCSYKCVAEYAAARALAGSVDWGEAP